MSEINFCNINKKTVVSSKQSPGVEEYFRKKDNSEFKGLTKEEFIERYPDIDLDNIKWRNRYTYVGLSGGEFLDRYPDIDIEKVKKNLHGNYMIIGNMGIAVPMFLNESDNWEFNAYDEHSISLHH